MLSDEEMEMRSYLLDLHKRLLERYQALSKINCSDKDFNALLLSIQELIEKSADLVSETAIRYLPIKDEKPDRPSA